MPLVRLVAGVEWSERTDEDDDTTSSLGDVVDGPLDPLIRSFSLSVPRLTRSR